MRGSPLRNNGSPIRDLEGRSPSRAHKLMTILEEDMHEIRSSHIATNIELQNENRILREKAKNFAD